MVFVMSRRGIELGHRLLLLKRTQGEKVVVGKLPPFYLQKIKPDIPIVREIIVFPVV